MKEYRMRHNPIAPSSSWAKRKTTDTVCNQNIFAHLRHGSASFSVVEKYPAKAKGNEISIHGRTNRTSVSIHTTWEIDWKWQLCHYCAAPFSGNHHSALEENLRNAHFSNFSKNLIFWSRPQSLDHKGYLVINITSACGRCRIPVFLIIVSVVNVAILVCIRQSLLLFSFLVISLDDLIDKFKQL